LEKAADVSISDIIKNKHLVLGIIAQFLNIGAQVSIWGNFVDIKLDLAKNSNLWIVNQIYQVTESMSATQIASFHASFAFLLFMVGRFVGTYFMGKFPSNKVLGIYSIGAVISMLIAILGGGIFAVVALMMVYFFQSIMFPTIFALACKDLGEGSKLASSLIIMSIVGGAIVPPITAFLFKSGTALALCVPLICFVFIVYYAFKGFEIQKLAK
jgi:FHS family L-fucose permease-like MFS transporter